MTTATATWPVGDCAGMTDNSDEALVARAKKGDTHAFSELARRHEHTVYNLCLRFMRDAVLAEDMAQEAFLKAFRSLGGFRGNAAFSTWMYRVTCSVCLTELAKRKRRGEVTLSPMHDVFDGEAAAPGASDTAEVIRACVAKLPPRYAKAITLYYFDELPYEEAAEVLGVSQGTLKTWMHRARRKLRSIVEKELSAHGRETI